ncbi:Acetyl esterase/lipase [Ruminococcaceae bacterium YRB3002]|nr:Acetyl esterase/lipase [Ruminococcaceae bacterium YRB3002]
MINRIMKASGASSYRHDLARLNLSAVSDSVTEIHDVDYLGGLPERRLDVYYCDGALGVGDFGSSARGSASMRPVLIDIHGGGFISYHKEFDRVYANVMATRGFVVFEVDFRLAYPEYTVFDQIEDIDKAVRWIVNHASSYGGDVNRLYLGGHSSGCVLAVCEALLCLDLSMLSDFGFDARNYSYSGLLLDCGLLHFYKKSIAYNGMRNMVFPSGYKDDKRFRYLVFENNDSVRGLPRTALITNPKDVLREMTYHFEGVLEKSGVEHRLFDRGSVGHTGIVFDPVRDGGELVDGVVEYLKR